MWQPSPAGRRKSKQTKPPKSTTANTGRLAAAQPGITPLPQPKVLQEAKKEVTKHPQASLTPLPRTETGPGRTKEAAKQPSVNSQSWGPGMHRPEVRGGVSAAEGGWSGDATVWPSLEAARSSSATAQPSHLAKDVSGSAAGRKSHGKDIPLAPERSEAMGGGALPTPSSAGDAVWCPERLTGAGSSRSAPTGPMGGLSNGRGAGMHAAAGQSRLEHPPNQFQLLDSNEPCSSVFAWA